MKATVKYCHRISPSPEDRAGPFPITDHDLSSLEHALSWLARTTGEHPRNEHARRTETGWVFFPPDRCGNWHSISIKVER